VVIFAMAGVLAEGLFRGAFGFWARMRRVVCFSKNGRAGRGLAEQAVTKLAERNHFLAL
jgi:hypothetical protein